MFRIDCLKITLRPCVIIVIITSPDPSCCCHGIRVLWNVRAGQGCELYHLLYKHQEGLPFFWSLLTLDHCFGTKGNRIKLSLCIPTWCPRPAGGGWVQTCKINTLWPKYFIVCIGMFEMQNPMPICIPFPIKHDQGFSVKTRSTWQNKPCSLTAESTGVSWLAYNCNQSI